MIVKFEPSWDFDKAHYIKADSIYAVRVQWDVNRTSEIVYIDYGPCGKHTIRCTESLDQVLKKIGWTPG